VKLRFAYRAWKARLRDQRLEVRVTRALVRRGDLVVDVGANKGTYVYWLRKRVGTSGRVLAYEPQPALATYLMLLSGAYGWTNVTVRQLALSNAQGKSGLFVPGRGASPAASLEANVISRMSGVRLETQTNTLDNELQKEGAPAFIKVDVEGHELAVFQGAEATLRQHKPHLLFECEERHLTKHSPRDVFAFLEGLGYEGYLLRGSALVPVAEFDPAVHQSRVGAGERFWRSADYHNNFLFVSRGFRLRDAGL
jgi:FkbM family methyltransferase